MSRAALGVLALLVLASLATGCRARSMSPLRVFAGAANKPAMERIASDFEHETGITLEIVYGGSGTVLSQLQLSGRGDIYLPGSQDYMDRAVTLGQVDPGSVAEVAWLVPALIVPEGNPAGVRGLQDLARPELRVGIGNPDSVCLGAFAIELLDHNGLLEQVLPNVVGFGASCSGVVDMAALGSADAVVGWRVVERWNPDRLDLVELEPGQIPRISWVPVGVSTHSEQPATAAHLVEYMVSEQGRAAYRASGYLTERSQALQLAPEATLGGRYRLPADWLTLMGARP